MSKAQTIVQIVPAQPGYYTLHFEYSKGSKTPIGWGKSPVLAWRVETNDANDNWNFITPITIENNREEDRMVLCPDGIVRGNDYEYQTAEQWFASFAKRDGE